MKTLSLILISFCILLNACASDRITASITVTNATLNGYTLTVNGNVRTWTNNVVTASTQIATNADATGCGSKTNLLDQIGLNMYANIALTDTGSNSIQLQGACGGALSVSIGGAWATVSYSTQVCMSATPIGVPFASYYASLTARTNTGSQLAQDLDTYDTNNVFIDLTKTQAVAGQKTFSNSNSVWNGKISQALETQNAIRGGYESNMFSYNLVVSNGVNIGNAFSSPGTGASGSEEFGSGAMAEANFATAVGFNSQTLAPNGTALGAGATANGTNSTALGTGSGTTSTSAIAIGNQSDVSGNSAIAIGDTAEAEADFSTAVGTLSLAAHTNSTALGYKSQTTAANQVMLGSPGISTVVQNNLTVQTNLSVGGNVSVSGSFLSPSVSGTNNYPANSDIAFTPLSLSSLANGNNADIPVGTNVIIEVSGPSGDFTINGISASTALRTGKRITLVNLTGFNMTIAHQSGVEPSASNRIISLTGADRTTTGNGAVELYYSGTSSRWVMTEFDP